MSSCHQILILLILAITTFAWGRHVASSTAERDLANKQQYITAKKTRTSIHRDTNKTRNSVLRGVNKSTAITFKNAAAAKSLRDRLVALAATAPLTALDFVLNRIHPLAQRELAITAILAEWVDHDPHGAWKWAKENSHNDLVGLLKEIGKNNPELCWEKVNEHTALHPEDSFLAYELAIDGITYSGDYKLVADKLETINLPQNNVTPHSQNSLLVPLIEKWAHYTPADVADWILALPDEPTSEKTSLANRTLINNWSTTDPEATLDYSLKLPENGAKRMAVTASIEKMVFAGEIEKPAAWLNEHAQGPEYDRDLYYMATHTALARDPEASIEWADAIETRYLKQEAYSQIAVEWLAHDWEAASAYFSENPLLNKEEMQEVEKMVVHRINDLNGLSHLNDLDDESTLPEDAETP